MKKNSKTKIVGIKVILVPYRKCFVHKYHRWMQSVELQQLTASEPLSEEEEYQMQQTWLHDEGKCTFIILNKLTMLEENDEVAAMVGDTNLYLKLIDGIVVAETGVMIAEESARRKGMGVEAMLLMLRYGVEQLGVTHYEAKIAMANTISIELYKKLKFQTASQSTVFQEVTLSRPVDVEWAEWLKDQTGYREYQDTEENA